LKIAKIMELPGASKIGKETGDKTGDVNGEMLHMEQLLSFSRFMRL
jgi:hypothetical protein